MENISNNVDNFVSENNSSVGTDSGDSDMTHALPGVDMPAPTRVSKLPDFMLLSLRSVSSHWIPILAEWLISISIDRRWRTPTVSSTCPS
jgi:hypothetical protein